MIFKVLETNFKLLKAILKVLKSISNVLKSIFKVLKLEITKIQSVPFVSQVKVHVQMELAAGVGVPSESAATRDRGRCTRGRRRTRQGSR